MSASPYYFEKILFESGQISRALAYIDEHWRLLERYNPRDEGTLLGLPHPYFVPSATGREGFGFEELYYWDTVYIAQAFIGTERHELACSLTKNLLSLIQRYGMVPNGSRSYLTSRSQPPFLTTLLLRLFESDKNSYWTGEAMDLAREEYYKVWMGTAQPHWRLVSHGLSRYYDANVLHELAEAESGWDMTNRFDRRCLDFLPVDLNALLYRYERDFETVARMRKDYHGAEGWARRAQKRARAMSSLMWNEDEGLFFDYDFRNNEQGKIPSLAAFYPLWAGSASRRQAARLVEQLPRFEFSGGLTATAMAPDSHPNPPQQWTYPNGWAPLQVIVSEGLERYGYRTEARRIARKWLRVCLDGYLKQGNFLEKYNVVHPGAKAHDGVYPSQSGFGWTNAIFVQLCDRYLEPYEYHRETKLKPLLKEERRPGLWSRRLRLS